MPLYKSYNVPLNCGCVNDGNIGIKVYIRVYTLYLVLIDKTHNCFLNCGCIGNIYFAQNLERHIRRDDPRDAEHARRGFWGTTLDVSVGADSADFAIVERLQAGDVVVTQDIGLASMVLGRDAAAIGVRGRVYDKATIDMQLFIRHEEKKVRRAGGRTRGPAAFTSEDRARFKRNLTELLR